MTSVIYKYVIKHKQEDTLQIFKHAKFLSVHMQNKQICAWFIVDPSEHTELRTFSVIGTGWEEDFNIKQYIGTVHDVPYVWHIFEVDAKNV